MSNILYPKDDKIISSLITECEEYLFGEPTDELGYSDVNKKENTYQLVLKIKLFLDNAVHDYHKSINSF